MGHVFPEGSEAAATLVPEGTNRGTSEVRARYNSSQRSHSEPLKGPEYGSLGRSVQNPYAITWHQWQAE